MNWPFTIAILCTSAILPLASPAVAQNRSEPRCARVVTLDSGERVLVAARAADCIDQPQVESEFSFAPSEPIVHTLVDPVNHSFQLFNNSYQDITSLQLFPRSAPNDVKRYGGIRQLSPGYAWNVNLQQGCDYDLLVEYEDGTQNYYEGVDTCSNNGMRLR